MLYIVSWGSQLSSEYDWDVFWRELRGSFNSKTLQETKKLFWSVSIKITAIKFRYAIEYEERAVHSWTKVYRIFFQRAVTSRWRGKSTICQFRNGNTSYFYKFVKCHRCRRNGLGPVPLNNEQPFKFAMSTYNRAAHHCVQRWTCVFTAFRDSHSESNLQQFRLRKLSPRSTRFHGILKFYVLYITLKNYVRLPTVPLDQPSWVINTSEPKTLFEAYLTSPLNDMGNIVCEKDGSWWTRMVEEVQRTKFKMLTTSRSRLSTANNSPYQHCGHCRPGAYPMLGVQLPSPLSFLPMVESLVTQLENVVISSLSCFCFDLLNSVYNRLFYTEVVH